MSRSNPARFFLKCDPAGRHFYEVRVYPTRQGMLSAVRRLGAPSCHTLASRAVCLRFEMRRPHPQHEQIGVLFFHQKDSGVEVIMHELAHAAIGWARKLGLQPVVPYGRAKMAGEAEERFASCLQYMVRQFYDSTAREAA